MIYDVIIHGATHTTTGDLNYAFDLAHKINAEQNTRFASVQNNYGDTFVETKDGYLVERYTPRG